MDKDKNSKQGEQIDTDILQCKADVLRAADIIPGNGTQNTGTEAKTKIPKFDLAEEIMAQQRKVTAIRRKAPGKKTKSQKLQVESIGYTIKQPIETPLEQEQIIVGIVARDIERLCSAVQNRQG